MSEPRDDEQEPKPPTAEEQAAADAAAQAAFEGAFKGGPGEPETPPEVDAGAGGDGEGVDGSASAADPAPPAPDAKPDEKKGKAKPAAPDPADDIERRVNAKVEQRVKSMEGRFGSLHKKMLAELKSLEEARKAGVAAPTQAQVKAAGESKAKEDELRAEFPEYFEFVDRQMADVRAAIPDPEKIAEQAVAKARAEWVNDLIEERHEDWQETVASAKFKAWYEKFPEDSEERRLGRSSKPRDAIKLLDRFAARVDDSEHATGAPPPEPPPDTSSNRRLEDAVPATRGGGTNRRDRVPSEEEAFRQGFREARGTS